MKTPEWISTLDRDMVVRRVALGGVILGTLVLSYITLKHRADHIGIPSPFSFFYPFTYDALILGASRTWQNADLSKPTRRLAAAVTLVAIAAAVAAFVAEFSPRGIAAVLFACAIPVALASALVLTSRAAADRKQAQPEITAEKPSAASNPRETGGKRDWIHKQLDAGVTLTGADIDRHFSNGTKSRNGARLLKSVMEERAKA